LFADYPQVRPLFKDADLSEQRWKLVQSLAVIVKSLEEPERLSRYLKDSGSRHAEYGIEEPYEPVSKTMLTTLAEVAGPAWNEELHAAWSDALGAVKGLMLAGAEARSETKHELVAVGQAATFSARTTAESRSNEGSWDSHQDRAAEPPAPKENRSMSIESPRKVSSHSSQTRGTQNFDQFYGMVEFAPLTNFFVELDGTVSYLNRKGHQILRQLSDKLGFGPEELVGGPISRLYRVLPEIGSGGPHGFDASDERSRTAYRTNGLTFTSFRWSTVRRTHRPLSGLGFGH
jgi:hemoglobin-like flavoprotein